MPATLELFISSKMQELRAEREALFEFVKTFDYGDIKLHAWEFEQDAPASGRSIRDIYLGALQNSALYIGVVWNEYGEWTVDELEKATDWGIERHLYVKDVDSQCVTHDSRNYLIDSVQFRQASQQNGLPRLRI